MTNSAVVATIDEREHVQNVVQRVVDFVQRGERIKLPAYDPSTEHAGSEVALLSIAHVQNDFQGTVGDFVYQFEGEDDLLHLFVVRKDGADLAVADAQSVLSFVLGKVPIALIWLKPGRVSHHFYVGHDVLLEFCTS